MSGICQIHYYLNKNNENPVRCFINSLNPNQRVKIFRLFDLIEEYGINSIPRHLKKLQGTPLWEIRIVGTDNIRIIYILPKQSVVVVLHGFIKKTKKTSTKELKVALTRLIDWNQRSA